MMVFLLKVPGTVGSEGKLIVGLGDGSEIRREDQLRLAVEIPLFTRF